MERRWGRTGRSSGRGSHNQNIGYEKKKSVFNKKKEKFRNTYTPKHKQNVFSVVGTNLKLNTRESEERNHVFAAIFRYILRPCLKS